MSTDVSTDAPSTPRPVRRLNINVVLTPELRQAVLAALGREQDGTDENISQFVRKAILREIKARALDSAQA